MADRIQTFTTKIFLNDDQAKNKIRELAKSISTIRADVSKAYQGLLSDALSVMFGDTTALAKHNVGNINAAMSIGNL